MKITTTLFLILGACAWQSFAQPAFDSSGDSQLNGAYYTRQVFYFVADQAGDLGEAVSIQGIITFNGSGSYSFSGSILDSATNSTTPKTYTATGTYVISASGEGYISGLNPNYTADSIVGLVSHSIFIGSSTENSTGYNDLFIAAPVGSTATNATLNGTYQVAYMDPTFPGDASFALTANGQGSIGTVNVTGYINNNTTASTETLTGVTYSFSNGAAQLNFGGTANSSTLISGTNLLYTSPDGNFIFGGNYNGFNMFIGVRAATTNPATYDGLYYQAGLDLNEAPLSQGYTLLDSYYGSLNASKGNVIAHQRLNSPLVYNGTSDYTYFDNYTLNGNGSSSDSYYNYWSSSDGTIRIGYGTGPSLGINVALMSPTFSGSAVYLSPVGVVNAASSAPFTAFLSPGEFLTLYGSGLAPNTNSAGVPFPNSLSGVQVLINQVPAPIYYVSSTQISVIVPYITNPNSVAQIQVVNNGKNSNIFTQFTGNTSVGVFTEPVGGIGDAAALHADYSLVSQSSPAQVGETISVYLAGMGGVSPSVPDGTAAPTNPLSNTTSSPNVYIADAAGNYLQASVSYSGLAPGFAGLYQINFTIPSGLAAGDDSLEIIGPDSDTFEAGLPIGSGTASVAASARASSENHRLAMRRHLLPKRVRDSMTVQP